MAGSTRSGRPGRASGLVAAGPAGLDAPFLAVFTPADAIGPDGRRHAAVITA